MLLHVQTNEYVISPGYAQPVGPLISVPRANSHQIHGPILLTDVYIQQLNGLTWLENRYFQPNNQIVSQSELLGPATPPSQLVAQGYVEMAQSQAAAKAAALTALGYKVPVRNAGSLIFAVSTNTPGAKVLKVGQIITGVGNVATPTSCSLSLAMRRYRPGDKVTLQVEQSSVNSSGVIESARTKPVEIRAGKPPAGLVDSGCPGISGPPTAFIGVEVQTQEDYSYPLPVSIRTSQIGGPSAGLAMTLGIIDDISGGHLTGNHTIAATGTIDPAGNVGDVGGVAQKTIAVERAGATVFFVPPQEYQAALSTDIPSLHVYPVSTLGQVLAILHKIGGSTIGKKP